jgi:signal transduction histidine kinase
VGVIEFFAEARVERDEMFLRVVRAIGTIVGRVIERQRARDALERANTYLEQRIAERTALLEAANRDLDAFTYSVAHDLRGPLRAIDGFARILVESYADTIDEKLPRYLRLVQANAERLGRLIDDLLLFSRLGNHPVTKQRVAPTPLLLEVMEHLSTEREGRSVQLQVDELPVCHADPHLLRQVFTNLLSNALKFTRPVPHAHIEIGAYAEHDDGVRHVYFVRDNGVGFDARYARKIFGVFERLHREEEFEGTGVGLAIVQRIIVRHGGQIWARSEIGRGATFFFSLPDGDVRHG